MADVKELKKLNRSQLNEFAIANGVADAADEAKYPEKASLAEAVSPLVTPEQLSEFVEAQKSSDENTENDEPADDENTDEPTPPEDAADDVPEDETTPPVNETSKKGTQTVYARLVKSYDHPRGHRRAGIEFQKGPLPQKVDVTKEQHDALKGDPTIEITTKAEYDKWSDHELTPEQSGSSKYLQDPANVAGEADTGGTPQRRRRYADSDPTRQDSPEHDGTTDLLESTLDGTEGQDNETPEDLTTLSLAELQTRASQAGVADVSKLRSKQAAIEAIETAGIKE